jgi:hypothetical protein
VTAALRWSWLNKERTKGTDGAFPLKIGGKYLDDVQDVPYVLNTRVVASANYLMVTVLDNLAANLVFEFWHSVVEQRSENRLKLEASQNSIPVQS